MTTLEALNFQGGTPPVFRNIQLAYLGVLNVKPQTSLSTKGRKGKIQNVKVLHICRTRLVYAVQLLHLLFFGFTFYIKKFHPSLFIVQPPSQLLIKHKHLTLEIADPN